MSSITNTCDSHNVAQSVATPKIPKKIPENFVKVAAATSVALAILGIYAAVGISTVIGPGSIVAIGSGLLAAQVVGLAKLKAKGPHEGMIRVAVKLSQIVIGAGVGVGVAAALTAYGTVVLLGLPEAGVIIGALSTAELVREFRKAQKNQ